MKKYFRWLVYRCPDCKRLIWFDDEPQYRICWPCFYMLDQRLTREDKAAMEKFERELDNNETGAGR